MPLPAMQHLHVSYALKPLSLSNFPLIARSPWCSHNIKVALVEHHHCRCLTPSYSRSIPT